MKIPEKRKSKKDKIKKKPILKEKKHQVLIVAQEIKFARLLSGNEKKTRDRVLKTLKKWILNCFTKEYEFKESDFIRIWKGLFYAVWMSDKPLIQEELCESIAEILDLFPPEQMKYAVLMTKAGFHVLAKEWYGLDQHRIDKFLMLVRRYLRGSLRCLRRAEWSEEACQMYAEMLSGPDGILSAQIPQYARNATTMILHVLDCYLEEISKVSQGDISPASMLHLASPLCSLLVHSASAPLVPAVRRCLTALIRQSEQGIEYADKTKAWESMGCPEGGPDALVLDEDASDDEEQAGDDDSEGEGEETDDDPALDPRAGRVNVVLSPLPVPGSGIAELLKSLIKTAPPKAQRRARIMADRFAELSRGEYPFRVDGVVLEENATDSGAVRLKAEQLRRLEKTLVASSDELALRGLTRKHRKRLLAKARAGISIVEEVEKLKANGDKENGEWQVETEEPPAKKAKQDTTDKENTPKTDKKKRRNKKNKPTGENITNNTPIKSDSEKNKQKPSKDKQSKKDIVNKKTSEIQNSNKNTSKVKKVKVNGETKPIKTSKNKDVSQKLTNVSPKLTNVSPKLTNVSPKLTNVTQKLTNGGQKLTNGGQKLTNGVNNKKDTKTQAEIKKNVKQTNQLQKTPKSEKVSYETPKKVKFVLKNNSMQGTVDYYKSVRQSPNIPYDGSKQPSKTNLKVCSPSPINPFFKKKMKLSKL